jgi:hypothetical protein
MSALMYVAHTQWAIINAWSGGIKQARRRDVNRRSTVYGSGVGAPTEAPAALGGGGSAGPCNAAPLPLTRPHTPSVTHG